MIGPRSSAVAAPQLTACTAVPGCDVNRMWGDGLPGADPSALAVIPHSPPRRPVRARRRRSPPRVRGGLGADPVRSAVEVELQTADPEAEAVVADDRAVAVAVAEGDAVLAD